MYLSIPKCTWVYLSVSECTWVYLSVPECTWVYLSPIPSPVQVSERDGDRHYNHFWTTTTTHPPLNFSKPLRAFIQYSWVYLSVPEYTWVYLSIPECTWLCHYLVSVLSLSCLIWETWSSTPKPCVLFQTFFLDFLGFFLKALGKHWKWPDSSRNAKKKISLLWWGMVPCTVQYRTVQNCTIQQQTLVWKYFFCNSGWIRTYSLVSRCFWLT